MVDSWNKRYGMGTAVNESNAHRDPFRLPSGIFALDFMLGGGFAMHQVGMLMGPEHGGKSSITMNLLQMVPRLCWRCFNIKDFCKCSQPAVTMRGVLADAEGKFNGAWAEAIGLQAKDFVLVHADDGNQYGDIICDALKADDCGLVILDSVAALIPTEMSSATLEDSFIGAQSRLVSRMILKITNGLMKERKRGHHCLVVYTNQLRSKIGVMFGSNETVAGGWAARYIPSAIVRVAKRAIPQADRDKYIDKTRDVLMAQKHAFKIEKYSNFVMGLEGEYIRAVEDIRTEKVTAAKGSILDHKTFITQAERHGFMEKHKGGFAFDGRVSTKAGFMEEWTKNVNIYYQDQRVLVEKIKERMVKYAEPRV